MKDGYDPEVDAKQRSEAWWAQNNELNLLIEKRIDQLEREQALLEKWEKLTVRFQGLLDRLESRLA